MFVSRARMAVFAVLTLVAVIGGGCSDASTDPTSTTQVDTSRAFQTVAEIAAELATGGVDCVLEYDGLTDDLREFSACTVNGQLLTLSVWTDAGDAQALLVDATGDVLVGQNWSILTADDPTRDRLRQILGGRTA